MSQPAYQPAAYYIRNWKQVDIDLLLAIKRVLEECQGETWSARRMAVELWGELAGEELTRKERSRREELVEHAYVEIQYKYSDQWNVKFTKLPRHVDQNDYTVAYCNPVNKTE